MNTHITIEDFINYYKVESSFVQQLNEHGLVHITTINHKACIAHDELGVVEKYRHFYYDLDINMPGIEAISHLLERIESLQAQVRSLKTY